MTWVRGTIALALAALCAAWIGAPAGAREAPRADSSFVFGVVPQQTLDEDDLRRMGAGGVESFRVWLGWQAVELEPGRFDWDGYDSLLAAAARQGVTPLPYLYGTPAWAARMDGQGCSGLSCIPFAPRSNTTRAAYANFAAQAVRRYGPAGTFWAENPQLPYHPVHSWQIWNEQNLPDYWRPHPDVSSYALLLRPAAAAIRAVDPDAEIVLGGMWGPRRAPRNVIPTTIYLRELYGEPGARESFDAFGVHPYDPRLRGVLRQIRRLRFVAKRHGDGEVDIWVTELGWASSGPKREPLVKDKREQARLLRRAYTKLRRLSGAWNVRGVYWYAWQDTPRRNAICDWCPGAGLYSIGGVAKPAWRDLSALARRAAR
jgi:polysaccharide biosynthesis protein PslG